MSPRPHILLAAMTAGAIAVGACTHKGYNFPPPPSTSVDESTTVPDFSKVALANVSGRTTTSVDTSPGQAHLAGTVAAPEGLVPGATVHVERLVEDVVVTSDVATNPDGTWRLDNIKGGRYRVRAWRAPDLAQTDPQVFFLNGNENKNLNLQVNHFTGTNVSAVIAPNPPRLDQPANLAVQVTGAVVDPTGIARIAPQPGVQVDLITGPGWELQSPPTGFTGPNGEAVWRVKCTALGNPSLVANVAGVPYPLNVSPCQLPPPSTVPPSQSPSTTARVSTTTTR